MVLLDSTSILLYWRTQVGGLLVIDRLTLQGEFLMVLLHLSILSPQLTVLIPCVGCRSRWAWSRVRLREFGEDFCFLGFSVSRSLLAVVRPWPQKCR